MRHSKNSDFVFSSEDLGKTIRLRRKKLGYTQQEIADFNDCSLRFISELERGKPGAGIEKVIRISNSLGLDIAVIERGDGSW